MKHPIEKEKKKERKVNRPKKNKEDKKNFEAKKKQVIFSSYGIHFVAL